MHPLSDLRQGVFCNIVKLRTVLLDGRIKLCYHNLHMLVWWNGRHQGLKIPWSQDRTGSSPVTSTKKEEAKPPLFWCW